MILTAPNNLPRFTSGQHWHSRTLQQSSQLHCCRSGLRLIITFFNPSSSHIVNETRVSHFLFSAVGPNVDWNNGTRDGGPVVISDLIHNYIPLNTPLAISAIGSFPLKPTLRYVRGGEVKASFCHATVSVQIIDQFLGKTIVSALLRYMS